MKMERIYTYTLEQNAISLDGGIKATLPMAMELNGVCYNMTLKESYADSAVYVCENTRVCVDFATDCLRFSFSHNFPSETEIYESVLFAGGIRIADFDRVLSVQPRNNQGLNMEFFSHLPDVSANGYFSPAELNMILGSRDGWIALGLLDIPDSKLCRIREDLSLLAESCGGNKRSTEYKAPEILVTFPENDWQAVTLFREKLIEYGRYTPNKLPFSEVPAWWKDPLICTYGDQLIEDRVGDLIDEEWTDKFVKCAEEKWGHTHLNLIIDDSWQPIHSFAPLTDAARFPDMREFTDKMHARGHHVILWTQPLFDSVINGFEPLSRKYGVLSDYFLEKEKGDYYRGCYMIDYTHDNARAYLRDICEGLFGSAPGQFNADGVKLDFIGLLRDPSETRTYSHPERGVGIKELYNFYKMFSEEARRVRPDVIIDCSLCDPRFEDFITHNRLHDTHAGVEEKELRARLATLACPDLLVDSDGALMYTSWLRRHYINAAVYSIPSNYYLNGFQDFHEWEGKEISLEDAQHYDLTPAERLAYGRLFGMTANRPDGHAVTDGNGSWKLIGADGQVNAVSLYGDTVIYYPEHKGGTGYVFTFRDEAMTLPLYGRHISLLAPAPERDFMLLDYARDRMTVHLLPGIVHTFRWEDSAESIDRAFADMRANCSETEMNYVN